MSIFKNEQVHPIVLLKACLKKYGIQCFEWEPQVFKVTLEKHTKTSVAKVNIHKLMAAINVANHDRFWEDWATFHYVCQALNNNMPVASHIQDFSVGQLMVAVDIANSIRKELGKVTYIPEFSEEVSKFIASQALEEGVWFLPEPLEFASNYAAKRMLQCVDCGNQEHLDTVDDDICPVCSNKYSIESLKDFSHDKQRLEKGFGKNTRIIEKNPVAPVARELDKYLLGKIEEFDITPEGICAAKLVVGLNYMTMRRSQHAEQI